MEDYSLLIVRPEAVHLHEEILTALEKRGYLILFKKHIDDWAAVATELYHEMSLRHMEAFLDYYEKNQWGNVFIAMVVRHKEGNTLEQLKKDVGSEKEYQHQKEESLRGIFGLSSSFNLSVEHLTFVYNGFHCPTTEKELQESLMTLGIHSTQFSSNPATKN